MLDEENLLELFVRDEVNEEEEDEDSPRSY
jgi:hypothetical protein